MAQATTRQRVRSGGGRSKWLALLGVTGIALVLTFAVGVLVGRHWLRPPHPIQTSAEPPAKKPAGTVRRSGLSEPPIERPPQQEKLTFYQTLTAPLNAPPAPARAELAKSPVTSAVAPPAAQDRPSALAGTGAARVDKFAAEHAAPLAASARADKPGAERPTSIRTSAADSRADWVVQVGAFRDRNQAESVRRPLAAAGFDVYVLAVPEGADVRYKVRLGGFRTRDEAVRVAQRVKQERSLAAFVAPR